MEVKHLGKLKAPAVEQSPERGLGTKALSAATRGAEAYALRIPDTVYNLANLGLQGAAQAQRFSELPEDFKKEFGIPEEFNPRGPAKELGFRTEIPSQLPFEKPSELLHKHVVNPIAEKIGGKGVLTPSSKPEQYFQDFAKDLGVFLNPKELAQGAFGGLKKAAKYAGLGNLAAFMTENLTGSHEKGQQVKMGTLLLTNLLEKPSLNEYVNKQYDIAKNVPEGTVINGQRIDEVLNQTQKLLDRRSFQGSENLQDLITKHTPDIQRGKIGWQDLIGLKKDINSWHAKSSGLAKEQLKTMRDVVKGVIKTAPSETHDKATKDILKKASEAALHADDLYSAVRKAEQVETWLDKAKRGGWGKYATVIPGYLFGGKLGALGAGAGIYAGNKLYKGFKFLNDNPEAWKAYKNIYTAFDKNDIKLAEKYLARIDELAAKKEPEFIQNQKEGFKRLGRLKKA
jgi:riboflavin synthase